MFMKTFQGHEFVRVSLITSPQLLAWIRYLLANATTRLLFSYPVGLTDYKNYLIQTNFSLFYIFYQKKFNIGGSTYLRDRPIYAYIRYVHTMCNINNNYLCIHATNSANLYVLVKYLINN